MTDQNAPDASGSPTGPPSTDNQPAADPTITIDDFLKVKLRVGRVLEAANHPNADKLIVLQVDLGDEKRKLCAGLRGHYEADALVGKNVIVVSNLAPRKMRGEISQGMILAASSADGSQVIALTTESDIAPGSSVS